MAVAGAEPDRAEFRPRLDQARTQRIALIHMHYNTSRDLHVDHSIGMHVEMGGVRAISAPKHYYSLGAEE